MCIPFYKFWDTVVASGTWTVYVKHEEIPGIGHLNWVWMWPGQSIWGTDSLQRAPRAHLSAASNDERACPLPSPATHPLLSHTPNVGVSPYRFSRNRHQLGSNVAQSVTLWNEANSSKTNIKRWGMALLVDGYTGGHVFRNKTISRLIFNNFEIIQNFKINKHLNHQITRSLFRRLLRSLANRQCPANDCGLWKISSRGNNHKCRNPNAGNRETSRHLTK